METPTAFCLLFYFVYSVIFMYVSYIVLLAEYDRHKQLISLLD